MIVETLGIHELWLFILSGLLLNITPGPDTAYIIGRSIQLGWRGGAAAAIGICCGCLVHVFGAAIGLSALLMASSTAFTVLKWVGAAYLLLTGVQMLLSHSRPLVEQAKDGNETSLSACSGRAR
jgi:threonine/homoserine/homoserine lactone efflux protein